jgi:hypothetical protein
VSPSGCEPTFSPSWFIALAPPAPATLRMITVDGPAMYLARWRCTTRASVSALPPAA